MTEDIFESISELEKKADEVVERARQQARHFREEVEGKLKDLALELERDYGRQREEVEQIVAAQREKLLQEFADRMRKSIETLDKIKSERIAPLVDQVIAAFLESTHGH